MKAITYKFEGLSWNWSRLLEVFINSWQANASIELHVHHPKPPVVGNRSAGFHYNHYKLMMWADNLNDDVIFTDCDMLCLDDITCGFDHVDHVGICKSQTYPFNAGVIFVKNTKQSKQFIQEWIAIDERMLNESSFHHFWTMKYAGINQASFGYLYENGFSDIISVLPDVYNMCNPWKGWSQAKMIHVKSQLRHAVMYGNNKYSDEVTQLKKIWERYAH